MAFGRTCKADGWCRHHQHPPSFFLALFLWMILLPTLLTASTIANPAKWIVRARGLSDENQQRLWMYQGSLFDPLDGRRIANVQGLELVRTTTPDDDNKNNSTLKIMPLLNDPNATFTDAATLLSQKIFCYTSLNNSQLLSQIRVRPQSPLKMIPLDQSVAVFETASTFIARETNDNHNKQELIVHSQFPDGKTLWGTCSNLKLGGSGRRTVEYTIFAKRRSPSSPMYQPELTPKSLTLGTNETIVAPRRSALIQIGPSSMEAKHKFGARETYSWTIPQEETAMKKRPWWLPQRRQGDAASNLQTNSNSRLSFSRYGEAPPFYAPGRMCMLEMQARPINNYDEATPILTALLKHHVQGWGGKFSDLQLKPEALLPTKDLPFLAQRKRQLGQIWGRLQGATKVEHHDGNSRVIPR